MGEKLEVKRFVEPEQLRDDTTFTEAGLNEAMLEQASLVAYYGTLAGEAQYQLDRFKQLLDIKEAQLARDIRDEAEFEGKKLTEKQLEQKLTLNMDIIGHRKAVNESKQVYEVIRNALEALRQRKDMIIQIGVRHRTELETQGRITMGEDRQKQRDAEGKARVKDVTSGLSS